MNLECCMVPDLYDYHEFHKLQRYDFIFDKYLYFNVNESL